jgi:5-methylcytosine-specific restriction endonuclease McrA
MGVRYYSRRRRRVMAKGEEIDPLTVFERAQWICFVCGELIDCEQRYPSDWCATVEHIFPISEGGTHTYDNVTASHRRCNERRSRP